MFLITTISSIDHEIDSNTDKYHQFIAHTPDNYYQSVRLSWRICSIDNGTDNDDDADSSHYHHDQYH